MMTSRAKKMLMFSPVFLAGFLLFVALGGVIVRALWNALLPHLFGWPSITFWQALGLLVLCRILFGGLGLRGGPPSRVHRHVRERLEGMSPEERERFRQGMRGGVGPEPGEGRSPTEAV